MATEVNWPGAWGLEIGSMDGKGFVGGWAGREDGVNRSCDTRLVAAIADDDGVDCALEVRGPCCGRIREGGVVDLFDFSRECAVDFAAFCFFRQIC